MTPHSAPDQGTKSISTPGYRAITITLLLCWFAIIVDGFDVGMFGAVAPSLLRDKGWNLTPATVGNIASVTLFGLLIGALAVGRLADAVGRRRTIIGSLTVFSLMMVVCAVATSPLQLGIGRFLTGLGLGGLLPTINAMITEFAPPARRRFFHSLAFTAFPMGGVLAAIVALAVVPEWGWRSMFWLGAAPVVVILPWLLRYLPESQAFLREKAAKAAPIRPAAPSVPGSVAVAENRFRAILSAPYLLASVLFALAFAANFFSGYGLTTWLPQIMTKQGYSLGSALTLLLVINLTATASLPVLGALSDRVGPKWVSSIAFGIAAAATAVLSTSPPVGVVYICVGLAGIGTSGLTIQLYAYVALHFPTVLRGTASGWAAGIGRLGAIAGPSVGGFLLAAKVAPQWNFWLFALANAIGALVLLAIPAALNTLDSDAGRVSQSAASAGEDVELRTKSSQGMTTVREATDDGPALT